MIPAMNGTPAEPTIVCPFLAYGEERDFRASVPDHRHRCFADSPAAPRALAHQAAYCLTPAFSGCPTFLDWARREAAPARDLVMPARTLRDTPVPRGGPATELGGEPREPRERSAAYPEVSAPSRPSGGPSREADDWAAAPPWVASLGREAAAPPGTRGRQVRERLGRRARLRGGGGASG